MYLKKIATLGALLGGLLSVLLAFPTTAASNQDSYLSFGSGYSRDRYSVYHPTTGKDGKPDMRLWGLKSFIRLPFWGSGNPTVFWDGKDNTVYFNGESPIPGHAGEYEAVVYALSYDKLKAIIESGSDKYGGALLYGGQPVVLPMPLNAVQARGVAGVSISPDTQGKYMAMSEAGELFVWDRTAPLPRIEAEMKAELSGQVGLIRRNKNGDVSQSDSSPLFFQSQGHTFVANGDWNGGFTAMFESHGQWHSWFGYNTVQTDPRATDAHVTSSPSYDKGLGLILFGVNNSHASDGVYGWCEELSPTGVAHSLGLHDGTLTNSPIDSSVVVVGASGDLTEAQGGDAIVIPQRNGDISWFNAQTRQWLEGWSYQGESTGGATSEDIAVVPEGPAEGNGTNPDDVDILNVDPTHTQVEGIRVDAADPKQYSYFDYSKIAGADRAVLNPSALFIPGLPTVAAQSDNYDYSLLVSESSAITGQSISAPGVNLDGVDSYYWDPTKGDYSELTTSGQGPAKPYPLLVFPSGGAATPSFSAPTPIPMGGGVVTLTSSGLYGWFPWRAPKIGVYHLAIQVSPNPVYADPGHTTTEDAFITAPSPDTAQTLTLSYPGLPPVPVASGGQPDAPSQYSEQVAQVDGQTVYVLQNLPTPPVPSSYPVTATAQVPQIGTVTAQTTLVVERGAAFYVTTNITGHLTFGPNPALYGQQIAAHAEVDSVSFSIPPWAEISGWFIQDARLFYPGKDPLFSVWHPGNPTHMGHETPMTTDQPPPTTTCQPTNGPTQTTTAINAFPPPPAPLGSTVPGKLHHPFKATAIFTENWWTGGGHTLSGRIVPILDPVESDPAAGVLNYVPARTFQAQALIDVHADWGGWIPVAVSEVYVKGPPAYTIITITWQWQTGCSIVTGVLDKTDTPAGESQITCDGVAKNIRGFAFIPPGN